MRDLDAVNWAYAAGVVDCDGHVGILGKMGDNAVSYRITVRVSGLSTNMIGWLQDTFGGHTHLQRRAGCHLSKRTLWQWVLERRKQAVWFLAGIRPYIRNKTVEVWLALEFAAQCPLYPNGRGQPYTTEDLALRAGYHRLMRYLHRGEAGIPHRRDLTRERVNG